MAIPVHWLQLALAIGCEVVATSALKSADGFTRPWPSLVALLGYVASFYCLSLALRAVPLGIAYAVWSGVGLSLISLVGLLCYQQTLDWPAVAGIVLIVCGVAVIGLFSTSLSH